MPAVSIIIPTYNRPKFLELTLANVYQQTFTDFEVIVVDDGTPGNVNEVLCSGYDRLIYKKIANTGGPIVPRNTGLKLATGKYIAFIDDDDLWMPDKLQKQVEILEKENDFGLVHGCCKVIDDLGIETGEIVGRLINKQRKHGYVFDDMVGNFTVMMPTSFFRKELIERVGFFNESMKAAGEDMEFFSRMAFYSKFYYIDEPIAYYRVHAGGISMENPHYYNLPLFLNQMMLNLKRTEELPTSRFRSVQNRLLLQQMSMAKNRKSYAKAILNCSKMSPFFWLKPKLMYGFVKRMNLLLRS